MSAVEALARFRAACDDPLAVAARQRAAGRRVVWLLGSDLPQELVEAFGYHPIRLVPDYAADRSATDALISAETLGLRGRALLATIAALPQSDALLISHADAEQAQLFATLRELARIAVLQPPPRAFADLLTIDRLATRTYNRTRLDQVIGWLASLGGQADEAAFSAAIEAGNAHRAEMRDCLALRRDGRLSGVDAHALMASAAILPRAEHRALLATITDPAPVEGVPLLLSGSDIEGLGVIERIERLGCVILGEDHGWGEARLARDLSPYDPLDALANAALNPNFGPYSSAAGRAARLAARAGGVARILHLTRQGDEAAPWEVAALRAALPKGVAFVSVAEGATDDQIGAFIETGTLPPREKPASAARPAPSAPPPPPPRSRKSLAAVARFGSYQREWFAGVRQAAESGTPFVAVNANAPQEILRAFDIPFVVNQWWASIVAAKQQSRRYAELLRANHLPPNVEAYSSQGVAAAFDTDPELAPWGGLPRPDILGAVYTTDATPRIFEAWARATGARLQSYERSIDTREEIPIDWWDGLAERWDEFIEPERLDLFEADLKSAIAGIEELTGRVFDAERFRHVMDLVNEQEDYYRLTRDLIATTVPVPVSVVDTMPATMVPQWHRGTEWARDAARDFYHEVRGRAEAGEAACPGERLRLMFVGRGLWSDMSFYQRWEESHGAVFVCSMYLSLAADGYIRRHDRGRDPLRALAARFVTMGDELRMPTWAGAWHVKEAKLHGCHGAMALSDADPLVVRSLRDAGIPVLELGIDNFARDPAAEAEMERRAAEFLDGLLAKA